MKCALCEKEIQRYDLTFNHLEIDNSHSVDICQECADKFLKWQRKIFVRLFPTKAMKKRYGEGK